MGNFNHLCKLANNLLKLSTEETNFPKSPYQTLIEDLGTVPNQTVIDAANKAARIAYRAYTKAAKFSFKWLVALFQPKIGKGILNIPEIQKFINVLEDWETEYKRADHAITLKEVLQNENSFEARRNKKSLPPELLNYKIKPKFTFEEKVEVTNEAMEDVLNLYENLKIIHESIIINDLSLSYPLDNFYWGKEKMVQKLEFDPTDPSNIGISYESPAKTIKDFLGALRQDIYNFLTDLHSLIKEYEKNKVAI